MREKREGGGGREREGEGKVWSNEHTHH